MIKTRFSRAIKTYDKAAIAQNMVVENLFDYINKDRAYHNILEIGAGSGNLTKEITRLNSHALYVNDICPEIVEIISKKVDNTDKITYLVGDAETLDFEDAVGSKFDLIVSSSTFQWFKDLKSLLSKTYSSLNDNGELVFSTFVKGNLKEINDTAGVSLNYHDRTEIIEMVESAGFTVVASHSESMKLNFDTPMSVLRHLKLTGVNSLSSQRWTRSTLDRFVSEYSSKFSVANGVVLTYTPIYIKAIKKIG